MVDGSRDDPPGEVQLRGAVGLDRLDGDLDRASVRRATQPRTRHAGVPRAHGTFCRTTGVRAVRRDVRRRWLGAPLVVDCFARYCDPGAMWRRPRSLLGDGLVRARLAR